MLKDAGLDGIVGGAGHVHAHKIVGVEGGRVVTRLVPVPLSMATAVTMMGTAMWLMGITCGRACARARARARA